MRTTHLVVLWLTLTLGLCINEVGVAGNRATVKPTALVPHGAGDARMSVLRTQRRGRLPRLPLGKRPLNPMKLIGDQLYIDNPNLLKLPGNADIVLASVVRDFTVSNTPWLDRNLRLPGYGKETRVVGVAGVDKTGRSRFFVRGYVVAQSSDEVVVKDTILLPLGLGTLTRLSFVTPTGVRSSRVSRQADKP